ncbi:nucleoside deaminase [bacterium]|nr:nucleoside deaminase [bacterium]
MPSRNPNDQYFMQLALQEAHKAFIDDEVPIGAVLVKDNEIIAQDHNRTKQFENPLAHAEKLILDSAPEKYLNNYTLYITLEPCLMCAGMIIWRRVGRVVFATYDKKAGAAGSVYNTLLDKHFNHNPAVTAGVFQEEAKELLQAFFKEKR